VRTRHHDEPIRSALEIDGIVGESSALQQVLEYVEIVAPTDSTVLLLGETGTGKELIARAIHNRSGRWSCSFVRMNCAAIPATLLESELFGYERGAFTGAVAQKAGRFEAAHGGTLFLDEVGDIPLELQSKFLRVLQEQEFERLGGIKTIDVDIRVIAATNRNLGELVAERKFRSDLFYRLNVFPIRMPALRERRRDIGALARHFTRKFATLMNKQVDTISDEAMEALLSYDWPGNIRELENVIERAVILSQGSILALPLKALQGRSELNDGTRLPTTLEDAQREHILRALEQSNGLVGGPDGAAARLGMKRSTLQSKMARLGIEPTRV
jgi:formate hydrogenlyase transcriptional activator